MSYISDQITHVKLIEYSNVKNWERNSALYTREDCLEIWGRHSKCRPTSVYITAIMQKHNLAWVIKTKNNNNNSRFCLRGLGITPKNTKYNSNATYLNLASLCTSWVWCCECRFDDGEEVLHQTYWKIKRNVLNPRLGASIGLRNFKINALISFFTVRLIIKNEKESAKNTSLPEHKQRRRVDQMSL